MIRDRDAVDPLERQHALLRAPPIDSRDAEACRLRRAMLSAISEMAAASSRRSISISVVRARLSTTAIGLKRRDGGWKRSIWRAAKK